jgi:hypothetical protein
MGYSSQYSLNSVFWNPTFLQEWPPFLKLAFEIRLKRKKVRGTTGHWQDIAEQNGDLILY